MDSNTHQSFHYQESMCPKFSRVKVLLVDDPKSNMKAWCWDGEHYPNEYVLEVRDFKGVGFSITHKLLGIYVWVRAWYRILILGA